MRLVSVAFYPTVFVNRTVWMLIFVWLVRCAYGNRRFFGGVRCGK